MVIELNGEEILNSRQFRNEIANAGAGSDIEMKIVRNSKTMYYKINLDERPKELGRVSMKPDKSKENVFGFSVTNITQDDVNKLNLESSNGVLIGGSEARFACLKRRFGCRNGDSGNKPSPD